MFLSSIWTVIIILQLSTAVDVTIISESNDENLHQDLTYLIGDGIKFKASSIEDLIQNFQNDFSLVIDLSLTDRDHFIISALASEHHFVHLILADDLAFYGNWTFSIVNSKASFSRAVSAFLKKMKWFTGVLFVNEEHLSVLSELKNEDIFQISDFIIESETEVSSLISRAVLNLGSYLYYVFCHDNSAEYIIGNLTQVNLLGLGSAVLFGLESSYKLYYEGSLIIIDAGQENTESDQQRVTTATANVLTLLLSKSSTMELESAYMIKKILDEQCIQRFCVDSYSIVNVKNGKREIVGSITDKEVILISNIIFPHNSTALPVSKIRSIEISMSDGILNPSSAPAPSNQILYKGAHTAIDVINNSSSILANYQLIANSFDCGASQFNANYSLNCFLKGKDKLGNAHLPSYSSSVTLGTLKTFKAMNLSIPTIGSASADPSLSSKINFSNFARVSIVNTYIGAMSVRVLRIFEWTGCSVLYQNETWGSSFYHAFEKEAQKQKFKIRNKEELRVLPPFLDANALKNHTDVFQEIIRSNSRLLVVLILPPMSSYVIEMLYQMGMRKGDLIIFFGAPYSQTAVYQTKDDNYNKRVEIGVPSLSLIQSSFIGEVGEEIRGYMKSKYGTDPKLTNYGSCQFYDGAMIVGLAIDTMINTGKDYTNHTMLMSQIRKTQFVGCSGTVKIDDESNDRLFFEFDLIGTKVGQSEAIDYYSIANIKTSGSSLITMITSFIYSDGSSRKPGEFILVDGDCPFPDSEVQMFFKGRVIVYCLCFFIALMAGLSTLIIWKRWWNIPIIDLVAKQEISIQDMIVGISIIVEFFQLISMGPDISNISQFIASIGDAVSLDLQSFINLKDGIYWILVDIILAFCMLWIILCATVLLKLDEKYEKFTIFKFLAWLADYMMPILGNLCFIPIISVLLNVYVCDNSIGDNFSDSFLAKDCFQFCWDQRHIIYSLFASFAIIGYEPLAVFCRPLWQEFQPMLHVKTSPLYFMVKTIFQILFIVLNKTVKRSNDIAHGFIFCFIMLLFILFVSKHKPFNYPRFSWWLLLSFLGVVWISFLSTIYLISKYNSTILWTLTLLAGWLTIIIIGLIVQRKKFPSLLFRHKSKDTSTLFRFAFSLTKSKIKVIPDL